ncbi:hypothetical protein M0R04_09895 [Candidatus Dojkabacteria bacterium]|jgi:hypothetical protein|nr:hypothetical protein [Candidatus Dojkabacteria bacterium]
MGTVVNTFKQTPKRSFSLLYLIWKYKFWVLLMLFTLPSVISAIQYAIATDNPTYPLFMFATRLFTADAVLQHDVELLQTNPSELVGMEKPDTGIWKNIVYGWLYFWNVIWKILGNVWLIFFPLILIHFFVKLHNTAEVFKGWMISIVIFLAYLFITNSVIFVHGLVSGNNLITIPENADVWTEYFILLKYMLPFHGLYALSKFILLAILT